MTARVLVGTCSWTDPTLLRCGRFYPVWADTPEKRLNFYSEHYPIVEVDSSYYGLPTERTAALWVERTPQEFTFNVKAYALLTHHPTDPRSLPNDMREHLPAELLEGKSNIYQRDLPEELINAVWDRLERALHPLDSAGKLGIVLFQFPPWFVPCSASRRYIEQVKERLPQYTVAIEFRNHLWLNERNRESTLRILNSLDLPYVCVDEPQGFMNSVPRIAAVTASTALVRFHGRNQTAWDKRGIEAAHRFNHLYATEELREWVGPVEQLASDSDEVHILFNNCYEDKAIQNADEFLDMLTPLMARSAANVVPPGRVCSSALQPLLL